jgi:hypothetical protein
MNNTPATILRSLFLTVPDLVNVPNDNTTVWPCYVSAMPDGDDIPHEAAAVYAVMGIKEARLMDDGKVIERYAVQVKTRARDYTVGWAKLGAVIAFIDKLKGATTTLGSYLYSVPSISRGVPLALGPEPGTKRRFLFTVNVTFVCTETSSE